MAEVIGAIFKEGGTSLADAKPKLRKSSVFIQLVKASIIGLSVGVPPRDKERGIL